MSTGYPHIPIGRGRFTRQTLTDRGPVGKVVTLAFWGTPPLVFVSAFEATGNPDSIGLPPVIGIAPSRSGRIDVTISGVDEGVKVFAGSGSMVTGGIITVEPRLYIADKNGNLLDDISDLMEATGRVECNLTADPIWRFEGEARISDRLPRKYQDWIAPRLDFIAPYEDGSGNGRTAFRLGTYKVRPYPSRSDQWGTTVLVSGYDALWTLRADINGSAYTVASGTNYSVAVRTLLDSRGFTRHAIQSTSSTLPKKRTWRSGTSWLQIANDLLRSNGFVPLYPDETGMLRSRRFQRMSDLEPAAIITGDDVVETVIIEPDEERFANHVVVLGNNPSGNAYRATRTNNDADSPASTVTLGFTKGIFEDSPDLTSQNAVDDRADYLMERANSMQVRMQVTTKRMRAFALHEAVAFDLKNPNGQVASGKWRMDSVSIPLGLDSEPTWVYSRLEPFEDV